MADSTTPTLSPSASPSPLPTSTPTAPAVDTETPTPTSTATPGQFGAAGPAELYVFRGSQVVLVSSAATPACGQLGLQLGDLLQARGDTAIYIVAGGCQRRHIPNPTTLQAIQAISHGNVKSLDPTDLQKLPAGSDIPDSYADPVGFQRTMDDIFPRDAVDDDGLRFGRFQAAGSSPAPADTATPSATSTAIPASATPTAGTTPVPTGATPTSGTTPTPTSGPPNPNPSATPSATPTPSGAPALTSVSITPGSPRPIAEVWPQLPVSFTLGVDGAAIFHNVLYLFKIGRYVAASGSQPTVTLTDVKGWPQGGVWAEGLVDLVIGLQQPDAVALVRGDHVVLLDPAAQTIIQGPTGLDALFGGDVLTQLKSQQLDALLITRPDQPVTAFAGPAAIEYASATAAQSSSTDYLPQAIGAWPATWHPVLKHAPSGRADGLWAAAQDGTVLHHDGASWRETAGRAMAVSAGADGSVFGIGLDSAQHQLLRLDGTNWRVVAQAAGTLAQVSVGDEQRVWGRDRSNAIH
ncbi:MAG: hypothetical protein JO023_10865, partial [Chloroflexi bacterium]|nr:hypothetical protein [Chloroflexota bacterium]